MKFKIVKDHEFKYYHVMYKKRWFNFWRYCTTKNEIGKFSQILFWESKEKAQDYIDFLTKNKVNLKRIK